jgi:hypothetical protein
MSIHLRGVGKRIFNFCKSAYEIRGPNDLRQSESVPFSAPKWSGLPLLLGRRMVPACNLIFRHHFFSAQVKNTDRTTWSRGQNQQFWKIFSRGLWRGKRLENGLRNAKVTNYVPGGGIVALAWKQCETRNRNMWRWRAEINDGNAGKSYWEPFKTDDSDDRQMSQP